MGSALTDEAFAHTSAPQREGKILGAGSLAPSYCYCNWSGRNKLVSPPDFQTVETKDPKEMGIIFKISSWEEGKGARRGDLSPGRRSHTILKSFQIHLTGRG